jgi:hypothetical protein
MKNHPSASEITTLEVATRVELKLGFKFTGKMVKKIKFTGKIGKNS